MLTQWFLHLVSVLKTEYRSDQNDLIRHVTDSIVLGFGVGEFLLASKQDTVRNVQIRAFAMHICVWTYVCHNSRAPSQPLIQCVQLGVSYFSKLLGTKMIFKDASV